MVAALFASAAGAPGYVAVMGMFGDGPPPSRRRRWRWTTLVAAIGVAGFHRAKILQARDWAPFAVLGVPASVIGGLINLPVETFRVAMTVILLAAGLQMAWAAA